MRNVYIIETLANVDIQELVNMVGKVLKIREGVIYKEKLKTSPFRKVTESLFNFRLKYENEGIDNMQKFVQLLMNCLYG